MKVIVCGAGQVGFNIARHLALEKNDVTVIDQSPELIHKVTDTLDVQGVIGHASHPDVLEQTGAADADMIIAVTYADEVNMTFFRSKGTALAGSDACHNVIMRAPSLKNTAG